MRLRTALAAVPTKELGHVGHSVADGRLIEILPESGPRWLIDPRPTEDPERYKLWQVGHVVIERGEVGALRLEVIRLLHGVLARWEGQSITPGWVHEARMAQVRLMAQNIGFTPGS